jgi:FAD/FMN-containing dehydrogenase
MGARQGATFGAAGAAMTTVVRPVLKMTQHPGRRRCSTSSSTVLTSEQPSYKHLVRGEFASVTAEDMAFFESVLPGRVVSDPADVAAYTEDWLAQYRGKGSVVLRPKTTEECSAIMKHCNDRLLAVNLQGGNTGLVGGSVPVHDEIVLSTSLMNAVVSLDPVANILVCESGCILENLDNYLSEHGFIMPLDLGAKGTCQIGGNVATNAGGLRLLRYGSLHGTVTGLEVVLADGTILDTLSYCRKDNTGYDLKQLFIGSEGTLGLVTKVAIQVPTKPAAVNVAFLACQTYEDCLKTFDLAKSGLGEILSAFEFMDGKSMKLTEKHMELQNPISEFPFYVLVETHGSVDSHDQEKLEGFLETAMTEGYVGDGIVAQDQTQFGKIWGIRESITQALSRDGVVFKYDISLPVKELYTIVEEMSARVDGLANVCLGFGHMGDGNLHLNIAAPEASPEVLAAIEPFVYEFTQSKGGSISAEHGLGVMKAEKIHYSRPAPAIALMQSIKDVMDPNRILNPYKTLPSRG